MKTHADHLRCIAGILAATLSLVASVAKGETGGEQTEAPLYRPYALSLDAGSMGLGGSFSWRFSDHWGARFGADYMLFSNTGVEVQDLHYTASLRLLSEPLTFDIYPWAKRSFRISVGLMFNQNQLAGTADNGTVIVDGQPVTIEALGQLDMKVEQQPVNPYFSIGGNFFYFDRAHRWGFGGELGVVYTGDPRTSLTRTGAVGGPLIDAALGIAQESLDEYAEKFKWWPVVKLQVTYAF